MPVGPRLTLLILLVILGLALPFVAVADDEAISGRPKIGLVLSGGGARGAAHIGVLKILEELRIPVDYVAGTSMGAIVGGLYASGMSSDDLDAVIRDTDWSGFYSDRQPRAERTLRRKSDESGFLVNFDLGVKNRRLVFPLGLVQGQKFEIALRRWLLPVATIKDFDQLPIPFRAVATDVTSGEMVVLSSGDLASAIRASMSAPGALKPVRLDGRVLVDGGITNNLPVQIVKDMGADILIVVDVGFPLLEEKELDSVLSVSSQMLTILIQANAKRQLEVMSDDDVLIAPELGRLGSTSFERSLEAMAIGERSAQQAVEKLRGLSLDEAHYTAHRSGQAQRQPGLPMINRVRIENQSLLSPKVIATRLTDQTGKTLDIDQLESDINDVYGFDTFESVTYSLSKIDSETELLLTGKEKSWGPNYLRFGVNLEDDFEGTSSYNLAARLTKTEMNKRGGELRIQGQIGTNPRILAEVYQPLDYRSQWFVSSSIEFSRSNNILFNDGRQIAQFRSKDTFINVAGGRQFGNWGEIRLAFGKVSSDSSIRIGDPSFGESSLDIRGSSLDFNYDTIDDDSVPRFGTQANLQWFASREALGSALTFDSASFAVLKPHTWGRNTLLHWWDFGAVTRGSIEPFSLGGLFSLSGYAPNEIGGKHRAIGRLIYYRRLGDDILPAFETSIYLGASIEAGNVWRSTSDISFDSALTAGSMFVALDTIIGPIYLAYGVAEGNRQSAYLFVGQTF